MGILWRLRGSCDLVQDADSIISETLLRSTRNETAAHCISNEKLPNVLLNVLPPRLVEEMAGSIGSFVSVS